MNLRPRVLLVVAFAAVLAGCVSEPGTTAQSTITPVHAWQELQAGMTSGQVELIMGKPRKVRGNPRKKGEIWVYERLDRTRVDPVSARVTQELWIDPITNEQKLIPVPLQGLQRTDWIEIVEIEIVDGGVASLERATVSRRTFTD
jgi:hypothetical protein